MNDKFDLFDTLGVLVPGILIVSWLFVCFTPLQEWAELAKYPEAFWVLVLTALSILFGHFVQSIGSFVEPLLFKTWRSPLRQSAQRGADRLLTI